MVKISTYKKLKYYLIFTGELVDYKFTFDDALEYLTYWPEELCIYNPEASLIKPRDEKSP